MADWDAAGLPDWVLREGYQVQLRMQNQIHIL